MCTAMGIIGTILVAKLAMRAIFRHRYGGGCGGGFAHRGWHRMRHHHRRHGFPPWARGPVNLGDLGYVDDDDPRANGVPFVDVAKRVDELMRKLELNARQATEAGDVLAALRGVIGPDRFVTAPEVLLALKAVAKTPFDADLAEAALGPRLAGAAGREARDALEHLHNILTEEQRATLLKLLTPTV